MQVSNDGNQASGQESQKAAAQDLMKFAFAASTEYVREIDQKRVVPSAQHLKFFRVALGKPAGRLF